MSSDTKSWILTITAFVLAVLVLLAGPASGAAPEKVWVCKMVGTPDDARMKEGKNPIHVNSNSADAQDGFSDAHPSFIVDGPDDERCQSSTTTSTTTSIPTTTSSIPESTTTTQPSTTTSTTERATQTTEVSTTTTTLAASSSTATASSPTTTAPSSSPDTLPYTGLNLWVPALMGVASLGLGLRLIRREAQ